MTEQILPIVNALKNSNANWKCQMEAALVIEAQDLILNHLFRGLDTVAEELEASGFKLPSLRTFIDGSKAMQKDILP